MQTMNFNLVKERQAELLREAENERLARRMPRNRASGIWGRLRARSKLSSRHHPADVVTAGVQVRWSTQQDEPAVSDLFDLNSLPRPAGPDVGFIVAERDGRVMAAISYRLEPKRLLLGPPIVDPWAEERPLSRALHAGARELASEVGARKVLTRLGGR